MSFYAILNSIWRRERQNDKLVGLEIDFFEKARAYLNHLENQANTEEDGLIKELFNKRWERATYLVNDLINLRIEKHIRETLDGKFRDDKDKEMPYEEKEFRSRLERLTSSFRESVHGIGEEEEASSEQTYYNDDKYQLIQMTKAENLSTVGADLLSYGPFKENDLVFLPVENSRVFIKKSKAERIEVR